MNLLGLRRRSLALTIVSIVLLPGAVYAGGMNLAWDDCGAYGTSVKTFACNTNAGFNTLIVSVVPSRTINLLGGAEIRIEGQTEWDVVQPWWDFRIGACRQGAMIADANFLTGPSSCADVWQGAATFLLSYGYQCGGSNRFCIVSLVSFLDGFGRRVDNFTEFYVVKIGIRNVATTGSNACVACLDDVCLGLQHVNLYSSRDMLADTITEPLTNRYVIWQSAGAITGGCPVTTRLRNRTWGGIKALYR